MKKSEMDKLKTLTVKPFKFYGNQPAVDVRVLLKLLATFEVDPDCKGNKECPKCGGDGWVWGFAKYSCDVCTKKPRKVIKR